MFLLFTIAFNCCFSFFSVNNKMDLAMGWQWVHIFSVKTISQLSAYLPLKFMQKHNELLKKKKMKTVHNENNLFSLSLSYRWLPNNSSSIYWCWRITSLPWGKENWPWWQSEVYFFGMMEIFNLFVNFYLKWRIILQSSLLLFITLFFLSLIFQNKNSCVLKMY